MQELVNTIIAQYTIIRLIARGGMSEIYLARDLHTHQEVALKLVPTSHQANCQRFQREVRAVASLHHASILPALDYGEAGPWCYLATPYIPNGTLRHRTQAGPLPRDATGKYLNQVASALHYAHQQGIIHRDIKSSNILMRDRDSVYLADFGLVKNTFHVAESLTETGVLIGTAEYMAPELAEKEATELSDIYSLGIVLYEMLTGDVPFKGSTPVGTFMQHLSKQPPRPSQVNPNLPTAFDNVVLRTLAKEPACRYQSALDLAKAYQQVLAISGQGYTDDADDTHTTERVLGWRAETSVVRASSRCHKPSRRVAGAAVALVAVTSCLLGSSAYVLQGATGNPGVPLTKSVMQPQVTPVPPDDRITPSFTQTKPPKDTGHADPSASPAQPGTTATTSHTDAPAVPSKNRASQRKDASPSPDQSKGTNKSKNNGGGNGKGGDR
jgi:serine/threonine protein kinase